MNQTLCSTMFRMFHLHEYKLSRDMSSLPHLGLNGPLWHYITVKSSMTVKLEALKRAPCVREVSRRVRNDAPSTESGARNRAAGFLWRGKRTLSTSVSHTFIVTPLQSTVTSLSLMCKGQQSETVDLLPIHTLQPDLVLKISNVILYHVSSLILMNQYGLHVASDCNMELFLFSLIFIMVLQFGPWISIYEIGSECTNIFFLPFFALLKNIQCYH